MEKELENIIGICKKAGLRKTTSLVALVKTMLNLTLPVTLADLLETKELKNKCNKVTVYRILQRLNENGIVRRIGLHERSAYFILLLPDSHRDYLICTSCNHIETIKAPCPVHELEKELAGQTGYKKLFHELEFFGICPKCTT